MSTARIPDGTPLGLVQAGLRFAYADPPYPGQSADLYANHPDYAGEVDHAELVERLCRDYPDGWALSTSGFSAARCSTATDSSERPRLCGGVQRGEIKSAGDTTGGARGGSRLGNPCGQDGLTR